MYHRWFSSKPRPWSLPGNAWLKFVIIAVTEDSLRIRAPRELPPFRNVGASPAGSSAVLKTPACPATPPSDQAFSSCTEPHTIPRGGDDWYSVAAIRGFFFGSGL